MGEGGVMIPGEIKELERTRKIYYGYYNTRDLAPHPVIRLEGKYLEYFGFTIGECIKVKIEPHKIIITKKQE